MGEQTLKLSSLPLDATEKARLQGLLDALVGYLGSPGDWGYGTRLGKFTIAAIELANEVRAASPAAEENQ